MSNAQQIQFVFADNEGYLCSALVDSYGFARMCVIPQQVDARIDERVNAAIALGELADSAGDRVQVSRIQDEQTELLESAATMQDEWSFTVFLSSEVTTLIWLNSATLQRLHAPAFSERDRYHFLLDRIHDHLREAARQSSMHPRHNQAPSA